MHADGRHQHVGPAPPAAEHFEKIADRRPRRAGDHGDSPRERRQPPLASGVEEPFPGQLIAELTQRQFQRPHALGLNLLDDELVLAVRRIDVDPSAADHFQPVGQVEPHPRQRAPPDHGRQLGLGVFEREVAVARAGPREVRYFPRHPHARQSVFQEPLDQQGQLEDREDALFVGHEWCSRCYDVTCIAELALVNRKCCIIMVGQDVDARKGRCVRPCSVPSVRRYVLGQAEHHRGMDYKQKYLGLLHKHEVEYDAQYLWD